MASAAFVNTTAPAPTSNEYFQWAINMHLIIEIDNNYISLVISDEATNKYFGIYELD
jgi:hypothetical protein